MTLPLTPPPLACPLCPLSSLYLPGAHSGEARRADAGGYQAVLRQRGAWGGGVPPKQAPRCCSQCPQHLPPWPPALRQQRAHGAPPAPTAPRCPSPATGARGLEAGHAVRPVRDAGHHPVRHLCQHPPQGAPPRLVSLRLCCLGFPGTGHRPAGPLSPTPAKRCAPLWFARAAQTACSPLRACGGAWPLERSAGAPLLLLQRAALTAPPPPSPLPQVDWLTDKMRERDHTVSATHGDMDQVGGRCRGKLGWGRWGWKGPLVGGPALMGGPAPVAPALQAAARRATSLSPPPLKCHARCRVLLLASGSVQLDPVPPSSPCCRTRAT